uniref:Uncharacterized protein n=1 Tax=Micromonospora carbonacea TaxID=47853 RepID=A0A7D6GAW4_9ACTN|nr:hypothetical protein HZU44_14460 [Micromonospora carbonacea]
MAGWAVAAGGLALAALGVYFVVAGLDDGNRLGSAIGLFATLVGLGVSVYGAVLSRRGVSQVSGQWVTDCDVTGGVTQLAGVTGSVRIGPPAKEPGRRGPHAPTPRQTGPDRGTAGGGGQAVAGSGVAGPVRQVREVGGDVEVDP